MDFKVDGDRTIVFFEEKDAFKITAYNLSGLERDLQREDLSDQSRRAIAEKIEKNTLRFLEEIGDNFGMTDALKKDSHKKICSSYSGLKRGINITLEVGVGWKGAEEDSYFSFPSEINMQVGEDEKSASIQWGFRGVERTPLSYMLRIHSAITGRYQLSRGDMGGHPGYTRLIVNPINEFPSFMEGVKQSYKLLRESGAEEELSRLQNKLTGDSTVDPIITGMYVKTFLDIFGIKIK